MEIIIGIVVIAVGLILQFIFDEKKKQKEDAKKEGFEKNNPDCVNIGQIQELFIYYNSNTQGLYLWDRKSNKENCVIKSCVYEKVIEAEPYFLILDNKNQILYIVNVIDSSYKELKYSELISIEIIEDGQLVYKKSVMRTIGGAIAGGVIAGGAGTVVGGLSGNTKAHKEVKSIIVKLLIRDIKTPSIELKLEGLFNKKQSIQIKDCLNVIIDKVEKESSKDVSQSIVDELLKLNALKEQGILTEEEFKKLKDRALNQ